MSNYSSLCIIDEDSPLLKILTLHKKSSDTAAPSSTTWVQGWVFPEGPLHHPQSAPVDVSKLSRAQEGISCFCSVPSLSFESV